MLVVVHYMLVMSAHVGDSCMLLLTIGKSIKIHAHLVVHEVHLLLLLIFKELLLHILGLLEIEPAAV